MNHFIQWTKSVKYPDFIEIEVCLGFKQQLIS